MIDIRNLYPAMYQSQLNYDSSENISVLYSIGSKNVSVSAQNTKSGNLNIKTEVIANMTFTDDDVQYFNVLDYLRFKGNIFFVDSTLSNSQTPSSSSASIFQSFDDGLSDSKSGSIFQILDLDKNKINHNIGLLFHSFSKGDVDKVSIALLLAKPLSNQIGYYQVFSNGSELTNKVQVSPDMVVSSFDLVKINGQNFYLIVFSRQDGFIYADLISADSLANDRVISKGFIKYETEPKPAKKIIVKGNRLRDGEAVIGILDYLGGVTIYIYNI